MGPAAQSGFAVATFYSGDSTMDSKMQPKTEVKMDGKTDILQGKWLELKGQVKQQWGQLTDSDMAKLTGKQEELAGVLQQRYGYSKEKAETEINNWLRDHDKKSTTQTPTPTKA
jgi:uncharacterized protein YjbJ (UPF0337 family)